MKRFARMFGLTTAFAMFGAVCVMVLSNGGDGRVARGAQQIAYTAEQIAHRVVDGVSRIFGGSEHAVEVEVRSNAYMDQGGQEGDEFTWSAHLQGGQIIEIKGINGAVFAEATDGSDVEVRAVKSARRSDISDVRIEVIEHADGVTLCAMYPTPRGKPDNQCGPGSEGRMSVKDNDTKVTFYVKVPGSVRFHGRTVNGRVEAQDLTADVLASTVNGSVEVRTAGYAEARTVNGSIDAVVGTMSPDGLSFATVNGSIDLDVPNDVDADVRAQWVNGRIVSDLPFSLEGRVSRRSARGALGAGGPLLELKTVNGSIRIH